MLPKELDTPNSDLPTMSLNQMMIIVVNKMDHTFNRTKPMQGEKPSLIFQPVLPVYMQVSND